MARKSRKETAAVAVQEADAACRAAIYVRLSVEDIDLGQYAVGIIEVRIIKVDETLTEVLRLIEIGHAASQRLVI